MKTDPPGWKTPYWTQSVCIRLELQSCWCSWTTKLLM